MIKTSVETTYTVGDRTLKTISEAEFYVRDTRDQAIDYAIAHPKFWGYGPREVRRILIEDL
jgi:hypothetical protein